MRVALVGVVARWTSWSRAISPSASYSAPPGARAARSSQAGTGSPSGKPVRTYSGSTTRRRSVPIQARDARTCAPTRAMAAVMAARASATEARSHSASRSAGRVPDTRDFPRRPSQVETLFLIMEHNSPAAEAGRPCTRGEGNDVTLHEARPGRYGQAAIMNLGRESDAHHLRPVGRDAGQARRRGPRRRGRRRRGALGPRTAPQRDGERRRARAGDEPGAYRHLHRASVHPQPDDDGAGGLDLDELSGGRFILGLGSGCGG